MTIRDKILHKIVVNQPDLVPLPEIKIDDVIRYDNNYDQFKRTLEGIGGRVILINDISILKNELTEDRATGNFIINTLPEIGNVNDSTFSLSATELENLEKVYLKGTIGVSENGSVWLYENQLNNRLLPFICQHLVLVIQLKDIVPTLHHAYQKINISKEGFGVFIAGPSKTADIEQSLVIGAHGSRSTTVYVIDNN
jgi:L-lactate dehydrogenase complex protein LldG